MILCFYFTDCFLSYDTIEKKFVMSKIKEERNCVTFQDVGLVNGSEDVGRVEGIDYPDCACASELAKMDAKETDDNEYTYVPYLFF